MANKEGKTLFSSLLSSEKSKKWLIFLLLLGMGLIFFSELLPQKEKQEETAQENPPRLTTEEYVAGLENKLEEMVSAIAGGACSVTLTVESGYKTVLAQEDKESLQEAEGKSSQSRETSYIVIKNADGSQSTVQVVQEEPQIRGVVVLCPNGKNAQVQQQVISAVTTVLHISSARVCVLNSN